MTTIPTRQLPRCVDEQHRDQNRAHSVVQVDDLMLAKMLQEQEQAMYMLAGGEPENAGWPRYAAG